MPLSMWATLHIFQYPCLQFRVRAELGHITSSDTAVTAKHLDVERLTKSPLLQSIYAETLRLIADVYLMRYADCAHLPIKEGIFPKKSVILASSVAVHTDLIVWNTGISGEHPVDQLWAHRFLAYPGETHSGLIKTAQASKLAQGNLSTDASTPVIHAPKSPVFSMTGTAAHWFPYGGGERFCPGRQYANR